MLRLGPIDFELRTRSLNDLVVAWKCSPLTNRSESEYAPAKAWLPSCSSTKAGKSRHIQRVDVGGASAHCS